MAMKYKALVFINRGYIKILNSRNEGKYVYYMKTKAWGSKFIKGGSYKRLEIGKSICILPYCKECRRLLLDEYALRTYRKTIPKYICLSCAQRIYKTRVTRLATFMHK